MQLLRRYSAGKAAEKEAKWSAWVDDRFVHVAGGLSRINSHALFVTGNSAFTRITSRRLTVQVVEFNRPRAACTRRLPGLATQALNPFEPPEM
jgi:hypothetical protein